MALFQISKVSNIEQKLLVVSDSKCLDYVKTDAIIISAKELNGKINCLLGSNRVEAIFFHSLRPYRINIPEKVVKVWIGMGFDYYDYIDIPLYSDKTKSIVRRANLLDIVKNVYLSKRKKKLAKKIDIFCPVLFEEYDLIKRKLKLNHVVDWNYGYLSDWIGSEHIDTPILNSDDINVLVGNSADPSNNHTEVLELLSEYNVSFDKLTLPVSYGKNYYLKRLEEKILSSNVSGNVELLKSFVDINTYNNILKNCSYAIMNHNRQQAYGNIIALLYFGKTLYINPINPLYNFLVRKGIVLKSTHDLKHGKLTKISERDTYSNRSIISNLYSCNCVDSKTMNLINEIKKVNSKKR